MRSERNTDGSQSGDVYSFAIILQEVTTCEDPFSTSNLSTEGLHFEKITLDYSQLRLVNGNILEVLSKLRSPPPLFRPFIPKGTPFPEIIDLMRQCWVESPEMRPSFNTIYETVKKLCKGK